MKKPKVVIFDTETLPIIAATFSLYPESINHKSIIKDSSIICICWKELGKKCKSVNILDGPKKKDVLDDYYVCKTIRDAFDDVDVLVGHNHRKFDIKRLNARLMFHGLPPLPLIQTIDTLTEIKKVAAFTSHRLDYLGTHLLGDSKKPTSEGLWLRCLQGDKAAIKEMTSYCVQDVILDEKLYLKIRPYLKGGVNLASIDTCNCPRCNSSNTMKDGARLRASGIRVQTYKCRDCGGNFSDNKTISKPISKV